MMNVFHARLGSESEELAGEIMSELFGEEYESAVGVSTVEMKRSLSLDLTCLLRILRDTLYTTKQ